MTTTFTVHNTNGTGTTTVKWRSSEPGCQQTQWAPYPTDCTRESYDIPWAANVTNYVKGKMQVLGRLAGLV